MKKLLEDLQDLEQELKVDSDGYKAVGKAIYVIDWLNASIKRIKQEVEL